MRLTKCDFMRGVQCPKMLWLDKHNPQYKVIPPDVRDRLEAGNDFGDRAMGMWGTYVEMTARTPSGRIDCSAMLFNTQAHLQKKTPVLCEAAFAVGDLYCAVDILRLDEEGCYQMYEVKDAEAVEPQFVLDAAFQYYVATRSIKISRVYIVIHGEGDLLVPCDVTDLIIATQKGLPAMINRVHAAGDTLDEPNVCCGKQCKTPYRCWYWDYCNTQKRRNKYERI